MKRYTPIHILIIFSMILSLPAWAQDSYEAIPTMQDGSSLEDIRSLRETALLVRLPTKQKSIDALIKTGREAKAEQLKADLRDRNLELMRAFKDEFSFCPVYFFYSSDSEYVLKGALDSVGFLDSTLTVDPNIAVNLDDFYTAEISLVEQDTSTKHRNLRDSDMDDRDNAREAKYYGGANMRFEALIIKDEYFNQLRRPFPYYSRTLNSFFLKKELSEVVKNMDSKLWKFYGK